MLGLVDIFLAIVVVALTASGQTAEPSPNLHDDESGVELKNNIINALLESQGIQNKPCYVEVKVPMREAGRCERLGGHARGCVTDNYVDPFHPHCF